MNVCIKLGSLVSIIMMFLFSCSDNSPPKYGIDPETGYETSYIIIEADSCEYIKFNSHTASWGGHRARCKYCAARNNKQCK